MNKRIANVVFYKFWDPTRKEITQQACVFYEDGTVANVTYEEGIDAAYEVAKSEKIKTQAEFTNMMNSRKVYTLTSEAFEKRYKEFLGKGVQMVSKKAVKPIVQVNPSETSKNSPAKVGITASANPSSKTTREKNIPIVVPVNNPIAEQIKDSKKEPQKASSTPIIIPASKKVTVPRDEQIDEPIITPADDKEPEEIAPNAKLTSAEKAAEKANKKNKKKGIFSRLWTKITAVVLAIAMAFTGGYHLGRNTKSGNIINNNISIENKNEIAPQDQAYLNLISKSTNKAQKAAMTHQSESLDLFNRDFAAAYIEEGKDIKAGLTWDEMIALNLAYNTYTKDQIRIMFNGSEVNSEAMSNAYKNATLQLMGAYVISTRENPVNSSQFLVNEEQKAFVEKYNDLFLQMKEKTGKERVAAIDAFYAELYKDFPIADEVREEGISHAGSRKLVEPYKAAVTPIVAAAEIMFQNVDDIDHTLSDKAIAYFNDLGLCNLVDEQFERAETITLAAEVDDKQPLYEEFRSAKIAELIYEGNYPTDDAHRDLSQLDEFQKWVNGHFLIINGVNTGTITTTSTHTVTNTTVTDDRDEAVQIAGEEAVKEAEEAVDQELEEQNQAAKEEAEQEAEENRQELQEEADEERQEHEEEVREDDEEMQEMLDEANRDAENGDQVNEEDFGDHEVDFDDEYEDGNGNLDDSVTDITTDDTGAVDENEPLPDPNQTGAEFDGQTVTSSNDNSSSITSTESYENTSGQEVYEYEEPYYGGMSNEEIVDAYIASLEGQGSNEAGYQYRK